MKYVILLCTLISPVATCATFNPTAGTPIWNIAAETGIIASAIEGTQTRIQQSDLSGGTYTINSPGRYAVVEDLTAPAGAITITINADNVYLDLNGFTIDGTGGSTAIISVASGIENSSICNGTLTNADSTALDVLSNATNITIQNIKATYSSNIGFQIAGTNCTIQQCSTAHNAGTGILLNAASNICITDISSYNDQGSGINMLNANDIVINDIAMYMSGNAGIQSNTIQRIHMQHTEIFNSGGPGIQLNNATDIALQEVIINAPSSEGISLAGTSSVITIAHFTIFEPGSHGIIINSDISSVIIEDGSVFGPNAQGINLSSNNANIFINNVNIDSAGINGIFCLNPISPIQIRNCKIANSVTNGIYFEANNLGTPLYDIVVDSCTAINNNENGFLFYSNPSSGVFTSTIIKNCVAIFNLLAGFNLHLSDSLIINNIANGNQTNFATVEPSSNNIEGNIAASPSTFNFDETVVVSPDYDIYVANFAWAAELGFAANYNTTNSVIKNVAISADGTTAPGAKSSLSYWTNVNAKEV